MADKQLKLMENKVSSFIKSFYKNLTFSTVSFYKWAYTTKGGSMFSNMLIDTDGDYFIAQEDMNFLQYVFF